jgi:hypothetical protein
LACFWTLINLLSCSVQQLAAKEVAQYFLTPAEKEPRQLTPRPPRPDAEDASFVTPDMTLYRVHVGTVPKEVEDELLNQKETVISIE